MVRPERRRAQPQVPFKTCRDWLRRCRPFNTLRPKRSGRPIVDFAHRPNCTGPDPFTEQASRLGCLIANGDLCCDAGLSRDLGYTPGLGDRMSQWLLAEYVLALFHRRDRNYRVRVIRCANDYRIQVSLFLEQFPIVYVCGAALILTRSCLARIV